MRKATLIERPFCFGEIKERSEKKNERLVLSRLFKAWLAYAQEDLVGDKQHKQPSAEIEFQPYRKSVAGGGHSISVPGDEEVREDREDEQDEGRP